MATSLQNISNKMMNMDIDKLGAQSLGLSLIPAVPDKFLIKYNPPKIWVVYHFKDHNAKDQYWRDIPLEVEDSSTSSSVTDFLFKEHSYYFDSSLITQDQVKKLIDMILKHNNKKEETKVMKEKPKEKEEEKHQNKGGFNRLLNDINRAKDFNPDIPANPPPKKSALDPIKNDPK